MMRKDSENEIVTKGGYCRSERSPHVKQNDRVERKIEKFSVVPDDCATGGNVLVYRYFGPTLAKRKILIVLRHRERRVTLKSPRFTSLWTFCSMRCK